MPLCAWRCCWSEALSWALTATVLLLGSAVAGYAWAQRAQRREIERLLDAADAKLERLQRQFECFVPADVIERLTDAGDELEPVRRYVTILFADLRGFTALCDRLDPAVTVAVLNGYFDHMIEAITQHHGHVTELVGDGLLALFGALQPNPWQGRDAVMAALAMRSALARYNRTLLERQLPELRFGIGIHGGEVIAGVIGTGALSKFSVTGDPINVASRVEVLTSAMQVDLLITEVIRDKLGDDFDLAPMPAAMVKGKAEPIRTWTVRADAGTVGGDQPDTSAAGGKGSTHREPRLSGP
jgi:adenylate cyclase